ncbi:helix-turn-helix domain-containing protein [Hyphobacterium sp. HN65]|uniref:Helix-turn-helix domain-containing protein n=1 Tax=Hyphobacterium lacteum TaxID=3116575 RepID=A0ABU7LR39_9PROT|nr:helix-turn-helix domain-containing protein [Hyphobacterium sp. HN65]MEE2526385.1 helix-turn-helix domain-containing protein [Hyphobacterium sp. HN65]
MEVVRAPISAFTEAHFTMSADEAWQGHGHDRWHLLEVRSGEIEQADSGNGIRLGAGSWRLSPAGAMHELQSRSITACRNIHVRDVRLGRRLSRQLARRNHFIGDHVLPSGGSDELALFECVARACQAIVRPDATEPPSWLVEARNDVLGTALPIETIAASFRASREHFARSFTDWFGCSPKQARQIAVLERVHKRLVATSEDLAGIAVDEGFYDQAHMTSAVRQKWGVTPGALRSQYGGSQISNTL